MVNCVIDNRDRMKIKNSCRIVCLVSAWASRTAVMELYMARHLIHIKSTVTVSLVSSWSSPTVGDGEDMARQIVILLTGGYDTIRLDWLSNVSCS